MPRRNHREQHEPLDLTPERLAPPASLGYRLPPAVAEHRARMQQLEISAANIKRQAEANAQDGIDWSLCLVPGCDKRANRTFGPPDRETARHLPLCFDHSIVAWRQVQHMSHDPVIIETAERVEQRERDHQERSTGRRPRGPNDGLMYFVRINDLVKVGWTADFWRRLKEYGAGAEVLCHYPATRAEETTLHRQLRSVLAKGREWYHDGDVIQLFVTQAIERHGQPTITKADWTEPRKDVIKLRSRR